MVLVLWLKLILYSTCVVLLLFWAFTGRQKQILLRLAGGCFLIAALLTILFHG